MNVSLSSQILSTFNYIDGFQLVFGSLCNILIIVTCLRESLKNNSSFILMKFISISNLIGLLGASSVRFFNQVLQLNMQYYNWTFCKVNTVINLFTFEWIIWIISFVPLQIHFSIKYSNFQQKYLTSFSIHVVCSFVGAILLVANSSLMFVEDVRPKSFNMSDGTLSDSFLLCFVPLEIENVLKYILLVNFIFIYSFHLNKNETLVFKDFILDFKGFNINYVCFCVARLHDFYVSYNQRTSQIKETS